MSVLATSVNTALILTIGLTDIRNYKMTYAGQALKAVFFPFKLITSPLSWLFKHRCAYIPGTDTCDSAWCAVGKHKEDGWRQWRAGEWVKSPKRLPLPSHVPPPPSTLKYRLANGRRVIVNVTVKITG